jgi:hypothetical protein
MSTLVRGNAPRHSFASYYLARFDNAAKLASQLGHVGQGLIFRHHREVVTRADANRCWNILPEVKRAKPAFYAKFYSSAHDAVMRVYDAAGNMVETHEHKAISRSGEVLRPE